MEHIQRPRTLQEVAAFLEEDKNVGTCSLSTLEEDSREVLKNSLFYAHKGHTVDGFDFMLKAQEQGAAAIICDYDKDPSAEQLKDVTIPLLHLKKGMSVGEFASWFYFSPSSKLRLIGITGTNGKSTVTQLIAQYLALFNRKCAVFGTLGYGFLPNLKQSSNTTLSAIALQKALAEAVKEGADYAALEVSSIGVCEGRIDGCIFSGGAFTNLTRDHLDYHKTMENYAKAKREFLNRVNPDHLCLNVDDAMGKTVATLKPEAILFSPKGALAVNSPDKSVKHALLNVTGIEYKHDGLKLRIDSSFGKGDASLSLLGSFNAENFLCALSVLLSFHFPLKDLLDKSSQLKPICGRMECFYKEGKPRMIVDYAHTPDGVESALKAARSHTPGGKVWCVLGCGGDRDKGKRPMMAIKACVYADKVIFTSDNPRTEDPVRILEDMESGVKGSADNYECIVKREDAITKAFKEAQSADCVVVAGKGHEDYQIIGKVKHHYSDREFVMSLLDLKA